MAKPLKIAIVAGVFPKLSETFVLQQICALLDLGHDVHVFAFEAAREKVALGNGGVNDALARTSRARIDYPASCWAPHAR
jgi:hypothetical protein